MSTVAARGFRDATLRDDVNSRSLVWGADAGRSSITTNGGSSPAGRA